MLNKQLTLQDDIHINNIRRGNIVTKKEKHEQVLEYKAIIRNQEIQIDFIDEDENEDGIIIPP